MNRDELIQTFRRILDLCDSAPDPVQALQQVKREVENYAHEFYLDLSQEPEHEQELPGLLEREN